MPMICHCICHLELNGGCSRSPDPLLEAYHDADGETEQLFIQKSSDCMIILSLAFYVLTY